MALTQSLRGSQRIGYYTIVLLVGAGALLFLALLLEWPSPWWSRPALGLQGLALLLLLLLTRGYPPVRLLLYPLVLAAGIYLWDHTLPPPNLPEGPLRELVPRLILLWLFAEGVLSFQRSRKMRWRAVQIRGRRLTLEDAATLLATTPADLRQRLGQAGRAIHIGEDGQEWLTLDDVRAIMK
ncbi:MAG TPA: hypothetical protein VFO07_19260 [Roseiflexaceae bacterium]|nr:hypothetical protein [Roseiflexaceae bacterium]